MTAESIVLLLLVVLVAGLLRSHADILRALHDLGVRVGDPSTGEATGPVGLPDPVRAHPDPGAYRPLGREGRRAADLVGVTPAGQAVALGVTSAGQDTVLAFLSSGCATCAGFWHTLGTGAHRQLAPARVVVVTRDPGEESESALATLAPPDLTVLMSSAAWDDYEVPGSPYFVHVASGAVAGEGTASRWEQLLSLYGQAAGDRAAPGTPSRPDPGASGPEREARADRELLAAGIEPGHPSLYPSSQAPAQAPAQVPMGRPPSAGDDVARPAGPGGR